MAIAKIRLLLRNEVLKHIHDADDLGSNVDSQLWDKIKNLPREIITTDQNKHHNLFILVMLIELLFEGWNVL